MGRQGVDEKPTIGSQPEFAAAHPAQARGGEALLGQILAGIPHAHIETVMLGEAPSFFEVGRAPWLFFRLRSATHVDSVRAYWHALLVTGLFQDLAEGLSLAGKTITFVAPGGEESDGGSTIVQGRGEEPQAPTREELRALVARGAAAASVSLKGLFVLTPLGRQALEIRVAVDDAKRFVRERGELLYDLVGELNDATRPLVEGTYVEVTDAQGRFVTVSAYGTRLGEGAGVTDPVFGPDVSRTLYPLEVRWVEPQGVLQFLDH